ncbi:ABC transporter B family member 15-like [Macadamia integrifolia]|uniref:ABC transporter B family member 15-like n=1 Tax=Macadamia integrifolia TaxID=60698 RepID=UPI001C4F4E76|nr:ABC transporter B family member 15-like [Macadamia integrifolia]
MVAEMGDKVGRVGTKTNSSSKSKINSILTIFQHADGKDKWLMFLGFIGAVGDGFSMPALFYVNGTAFNNFGGTPSTNSQDYASKTNQMALYLLYVACGSLVASFMEGYCWTRTGERQATRMRERYLKAVLRQDIGYFDLQVFSSTQVITSVSYDTLLIQDFISEKLPNFIMNLMTFVGSYVMAFVLMWRLALVVLPFIVLAIAPGLICGRILMGMAKKVGEEYDKAGRIVEQTVSSIRMVYSFVGESRIMAEFSAALQGCVRLGLKEGLVKGMAIGSTNIVISVWSFMFWFGSKLVMYHGGRGGTIFAVGTCITFGGMSLGSGFMNLKYFSEACAAGDRIMQIVTRVPKIDSENTEGETLQSISGEIEFKHIEFAYPSRPENVILRDFSLRVPAGSKVALVGGSGSGKSTIISLLQRFYDPLGGEILLDGFNIVKLQLKWLRAQMGLVSQEPALFNTSIKENMLFGKEGATMDEVVAAAKSANAHSFISQLPQGYDTQVGEGGIQLSGGQKQRIAIARAVIRAPKILLLDEATSALDSESERIVQEALDKAVVGRTTIVIAHRLSTIHNAETIAVVQNGHIMESGSHLELIQCENGLYTSLVRHQQQTEEKTKEEQSPLTFPSSFPPSKPDNVNVTKCKLSSERRSNSANSTEASHQVSHRREGNDIQELHVPSFRRLLVLNLPEWKQAILGCVSAALVGAVQPLLTIIMVSMVSVYFLPTHEEIKSKTRMYSFLFLGLTLFSFAIHICEHYYFAVMGESLTRRIRERMLSKVLSFEVGWFDQDSNSTGAVCSRLAKDANMVRSLVGDRMALLIQTFSAVTIACTIGTVIAWRLAIVIMASQPLFILCNYFQLVLLKKMSNKAIKAQAESSKLAADAASNIRTVTVFSSQARVLDMLAKAQEGPRRDGIFQAWLAGVVLGTCQGLMYCTRAFQYWYGGKLISEGHITGKAFLEAFFTLIITGRIIVDAGIMTTDLARGGDAIRSVFSILDRNTWIEPDFPKGYQPERLIGQVELRDVHFSYPARPNVAIFRGFSLSIEARRSTALVGQSGSGKSTIIGLIERFYDASKGTVEIDGMDIKVYHLRSLRRHIGLVSQEPTLFSGTIRDNIAYGAFDGCKVDEVEIIKAARAANAHDFITALNDGYNTWCGDRGVQLSGGQKQRIAISRAILKNPAVLLLDEATSALDSVSEKVVQEALERVMVGRTSIVVAHRLSTIQNCDEIVVLEGGKVVEKGTHSALLAEGPTGVYCSLVKLQKTPSAH